jgi:hypothetical protein
MRRASLATSKIWIIPTLRSKRRKLWTTSNGRIAAKILRRSWDYQKNFVQMLVEKIGLMNLSRRLVPDTMCLSAMVVVPRRSGSESAF